MTIVPNELQYYEANISDIWLLLLIKGQMILLLILHCQLWRGKILQNKKAATIKGFIPIAKWQLLTCCCMRFSQPKAIF